MASCETCNAKYDSNNSECDINNCYENSNWVKQYSNQMLRDLENENLKLKKELHKLYYENGDLEIKLEIIEKAIEYFNAHIIIDNGYTMLFGNKIKHEEDVSLKELLVRYEKELVNE